MAAPDAQRATAPGRPVPESVGVSTERLARMHAAMQQFVDHKEVSGLVTLVERGGRVVDVYSAGEQDIERHVKMSDAAIFRIASMSKPITAVAILMLHEEGKFLLTDPVSRFIPGFRDMKVIATDGTTAARRPMTIRDLLTHRSGIAYGFLDRGPVGNAYRSAGVPDGLSTYDGTLAEAIDKLAAQPLLSQPGAEWHYSLAFDVLGRVVEVASGKPFDQFLQERLLGPLRMTDTSFVVTDAKWPRFATAYVREGNDLRPIKDPETFNGTLTYSPWAMYKGPKRHFSGGAGLTSTARDYARFTQMLVNGGELDGIRILSPKTVELMSTSHTSDLPPGAVSIGGPGNSFGLGVRVVTDLGASQTLGSVGMYGWTGIYGTSFWVDPKEKLSGVLMIQRNGGVAPVQNTFQTMTYQAIVR
ncbi:MAG TPA: serine hydrolase domain-containing protein [Vicinamibacterales bacterium]|nr:serine hydrolase domain-containing protein [Vicinamibacterales bacterium]